MRIFLVIIFIFYLKFGARSIKYQLYLKDQCTGEVTEAKNYSLSFDNKTFYVEDFKTPTISVPKEGTYLLKSEYPYLETYIEVNLSKTKDTLFLASISELVQVPKSHSSKMVEEKRREIALKMRSKFFKCDSILLQEDYQDYYSNGNLRLKGYFKNGFAIDTLREYYYNNRLARIRYFDKDGILLKTKSFDIKGNEIKK